MKTLAELEADLAKLQAEIAERKKPKGRYVPKDGDKVYSVSMSKPEVLIYDEYNPHHKHLANLGLLVPTIEEYNRVVAKMKAQTKLLRCEGVREGFKFGEGNWYFERSENKFDLSFSQVYHIGSKAYFDTEKQTKAAFSSLTKEELDALFPVAV